VFEDEFYPNSYFYRKTFLNHPDILFSDFNKMEVKILHDLDYKMFISYENLKRFIDFYSESVSPNVIHSISKLQLEDSKFAIIVNPQTIQNKSKNLHLLKKMTNQHQKSDESEYTLGETLKNQRMTKLFKEFSKKENILEFVDFLELAFQYEKTSFQKERKILIDRFWNEFVNIFPGIKSMISDDYLDYIFQKSTSNDALASDLLKEMFEITENHLDSTFTKFKTTDEFQFEFSRNFKLSLPLKSNLVKKKTRSTSFQTKTNTPSFHSVPYKSPSGKLDKKSPFEKSIHVVDLLLSKFKKK
jgi:hypothetical protein